MRVRAVRRCGQRVIAAKVAVRRQRSSGLPVLRRSASRGFGFEQVTFPHAASLAHLSRVAELSNPIPIHGSLFQRSLSSSALRRSAAPGCKVGAGTSFARAASVGALVYRNNAALVVPREGRCLCARVGALGHRQGLALVGGHAGLLLTARPNTSIEGTHSGLRPPCAPQVKR